MVQVVWEEVDIHLQRCLQIMEDQMMLLKYIDPIMRKQEDQVADMVIQVLQVLQINRCHQALTISLIITTLITITDQTLQLFQVKVQCQLSRPLIKAKRMQREIKVILEHWVHQ